MKKLFILFCLIMIFALDAAQFPHLILNFDINKTLIASDKTENKSIEDVINELLSKKYSACWDENIAKPITFEAYVRNVILPGEEHDIQLKMERLGYIIHFTDYLREHQHPLYQTVIEEFTVILNTLKKIQGNVFPSFYCLIAELNEKGIPYTIFLRSYGKEVFEVKNEIQTVFPNLFKMDAMFQRGTLYVDESENLSEPQAIYHFFCAKEHAAIRDDWKYWVEGEMKASYGKPFYIDPEDKSILPLFFDDNIKINSVEKNIIAPINPKTGEMISILSLIQSKQMIPVNTLDAILNERYYIQWVEEALRMHEWGLKK